MTASLLLLNWKRLANVRRILAAQAGYREVAEILVFNNNSSAPFDYSHPKVRFLNASADFGLRARWILAALAKSECLIFQDDDILLPASTVGGFIGAVAADRRRAYSLHGRNPGRNGTYRADLAFGEVEIILTRAAAIHAELVPLIFQAEQAFHAAGFQLPLNNGEDIFLSYCVSARFGKKHKVLRLPFADLPSPHALSNRPEHVKERTRLVRQCKAFFARRQRTTDC
ncbi:MAG: hypothetical protein C5B50_05130 [Verrucomicrobia bacterium]|nr:MAG: hypothetical protein C5B50_05130 [Verrucomicrobiota bacterium]